MLEYDLKMASKFLGFLGSIKINSDDADRHSGCSKEHGIMILFTKGFPTLHVLIRLESSNNTKSETLFSLVGF